MILANTSGAGALLVVIVLAFAVFEIAAFWRIFTKAGRSGWASIVPIYNAYVLLRISGKSGWWLLLYFIPFVNLIAAIIVLNELARSFGRGGGFTIGLVLLGPIFFPILGFGSDRYLGPGGYAATGVEPFHGPDGRIV